MWTAIAILALAVAFGVLIEIVAGSIAGAMLKRWME